MRKYRKRPPAVSQGWLRVLSEMGEDLSVGEWAARAEVDDSEIHSALKHIKRERRLEEASP